MNYRNRQKSINAKNVNTGGAVLFNGGKWSGKHRHPDNDKKSDSDSDSDSKSESESDDDDEEEEVEVEVGQEQEQDDDDDDDQNDNDNDDDNTTTPPTGQPPAGRPRPPTIASPSAPRLNRRGGKFGVRPIKNTFDSNSHKNFEVTYLPHHNTLYNARVLTNFP